ncbi:hypothetical protein [Bacillus solitudinis]|uniref:hypothetical protein n=1 Tax=Bacillus solitudinis TaxID=2014074 RepID=UPI000C24F4ED|nr:hypothetical protein [Bacillus solitudinis]
MKVWVSCLLTGVVLLTGCNDQETPQAQNVNIDQITYGLLGPGPANYHGIQKLPTYRSQGEENTTGTSFRKMNANRQDLGDDQLTIHEIVENDSPFKAGMVIIAGSHAWVNITPPSDMEPNEKKKKLSALRQELTQKIPRYQVHLRDNSKSS